MSLMAFSTGFISPLGFRTGLLIFKKNSGMASSLLAAIPFLGSTLTSYVVHYICQTNLVHLAFFCSAIIIAGACGLIGMCDA